MRFSELIPCLDRNLIYQLKLKLNLSLMEHYERHCPPPSRRYNCLIPPPVGYKVSAPFLDSISILRFFSFLFAHPLCFPKPDLYVPKRFR